MKRVTKTMILMISSLTEKGRGEKPWTCVMRKVLICFLTCIFLLFNVSTGVAEEEEKKEEKTVLEEITVIGTPLPIRLLRLIPVTAPSTIW